MKYLQEKRKPGAVRDAIIEALAYKPSGATVAEIARDVSVRIGETPASSVRSYLRLNTPRLFTKVDRGHYRVREETQTTLALPKENGYYAPKRLPPKGAFRFGNATLIHGDCFEWLSTAASNSIEAVVTDPPYGLIEYSEHEQEKLRAGRGGVWRIPPSFDGNKRAPLPRFTVLSRDDIAELERFFFALGAAALANRCAGRSGNSRIQSAALFRRRQCDHARGFRASRRDHPPDHDNARRRSTESGA